MKTIDRDLRRDVSGRSSEVPEIPPLASFRARRDRHAVTVALAKVPAEQAPGRGVGGLTSLTREICEDVESGAVTPGQAALNVFAQIRPGWFGRFDEG
ncbi:hypothetical protein [Streptomyces sp. NPDC090112]|uniref:hypothetical protein n=1 Tax=Streptomyces sp. NPDC090112 TaxID=3365949 RepID=UPI0037F6E3E4